MAEPMSTAPGRMEDADESRVRSLIIPTWLPIAAIAHMASIPTKTALAIVQRKCNEWALEVRRVRIDGKNPVHIIRRRNPDRMLVMGVWLPVAAIDEVEE